MNIWGKGVYAGFGDEEDEKKIIEKKVSGKKGRAISELNMVAEMDLLLELHA